MNLYIFVFEMIAQYGKSSRVRLCGFPHLFIEEVLAEPKQASPR